MKLGPENGGNGESQQPKINKNQSNPKLSRGEAGAGSPTSYAVAPSHRSIRQKCRGGARNSGNRVTQTLSFAQQKNLIAAGRFAVEIGMPLNRFIKLHLELGGVIGRSAFQTLKDFLSRVRRWLHANGVPLCVVWARENGACEGEHVHLALHIPRSLYSMFHRRQRRWMKQSGLDVRKHVIKSEPIAGRKDAAERWQRQYMEQLDIVLAYISKATGSYFEKGVGNIVGKRAGFSQCIGPAARKSFQADITKR